MTNQEIIRLLRRLKAETGSLDCLGCGHEYNCSTSGCAIMRAAADQLEKSVDRCARYAEEIAVLQERQKWISEERFLRLAAYEEAEQALKEPTKEATHE